MGCRQRALDYQKSEQGALVRGTAEARAARVPCVIRPYHRPSAAPRGLINGSAAAVSTAPRSLGRCGGGDVSVALIAFALLYTLRQIDETHQRN